MPYFHSSQISLLNFLWLLRCSAVTDFIFGSGQFYITQLIEGGKPGHAFRNSKGNRMTSATNWIILNYVLGQGSFGEYSLLDGTYSLVEVWCLIEMESVYSQHFFTGHLGIEQNMNLRMWISSAALDIIAGCSKVYSHTAPELFVLSCIKNCTCLNHQIIQPEKGRSLDLWTPKRFGQGNLIKLN